MLGNFHHQGGRNAWEQYHHGGGCSAFAQHEFRIKSTHKSATVSSDYNRPIRPVPGPFCRPKQSAGRLLWQERPQRPPALLLTLSADPDLPISATEEGRQACGALRPAGA